jgi:hypothetical protein
MRVRSAMRRRQQRPLSVAAAVAFHLVNRASHGSLWACQFARTDVPNTFGDGFRPANGGGARKTGFQDLKGNQPATPNDNSMYLGIQRLERHACRKVELVCLADVRERACDSVIDWPQRLPRSR